MSEHTPTPWLIKNEEAIKIADSKGDSILSMYHTHLRGRHPTNVVEANAAFIVKAVNSHDELITELKLIADWRKVSLAGEYEHSLRDVIRSMLDCADRALASIKEHSK